MRRIPVPPGYLDDLNPGDPLTLPAEQAHYLRDVLRARPEDRVELFDGRGVCAYGQVLSVDEELRLRIRRVEKVEKGESPLAITLFQAIPKGKRWEWILEKATELGVQRIVPLQTDRTVVQVPDERIPGKMKRWKKILTSAARQCGRSRVPELSRPLSMSDARESCEVDIDLVAHPGPGARLPSSILNQSELDISTVGLWIGPEGGFEDREIQRLKTFGARPISLGPRILRADTAGITALTLLQSAAGDLADQ